MTNDKTNKEWKRYLKLMIERPNLFIPHPDYKFITMDEDVTDYEQKHNCTLGVVYETAQNLFIADLISHNGTYMVKERLVPNTTKKHILIIPIIDDKFILLPKFYHPIRNYMYAFPSTFVESGYMPKEYSIKFLKNLFGPCSCTSFYLNDIEPNTEHYQCTTSVFAVKMERINLKKRKYISFDYKLMTEMQMADYIAGSLEFLHRDSYTISAYAMYTETENQIGLF